MFNIFSAIIAACAAKDVVKEKLEKAPPSGTRFDYAQYHADSVNPDISIKERVKKIDSCAYFTRESEDSNTQKSMIVDIGRYTFDKYYYSEKTANDWAKMGKYQHITDTKEKVVDIERLQYDWENAEDNCEQNLLFCKLAF